MSGPTSLWFVVLVCFLVRVSGGETDEPAEPGEPVLLPCEAKKNITKVEWKRGNDTVCETKNPDVIQCQIVSPSFTNRVQLKKELKSRDASLILTDVKETDAGKYECYVELSGGKRRKRDVGLEPLNTVNLKIEQGETAKTAKPGRSVVLPCKAETNVTTVEWRRENDTVCETKNPDDTQCQIVSPSFTNRVHLTEVLKSGDASLILTNVNETDAGKYECYVTLSGGNRTKRDADQKPFSTVNLKIETGGAKKEGDVAGGAKKEGDTTGGDKGGLIAATTISLFVAAAAVVVAAVLGFLYRRERNRRSDLSNNKPAANEAAETQQPLQSP